WQAPAFLVCGDDLPGIVNALRRKNRVGAAESWGGMHHATGNYSADVDLAPGFALTNTWAPSAAAWFWSSSRVAPCQACGDKELRTAREEGGVAEPYLGPSWRCESYANGQLVFRPELSRDTCLQSFAAVENVKVSGDGLVPAQASQVARVTVRLQS